MAAKNLYKVDHDSEALASYVFKEGEPPICMCSWTVVEVPDLQAMENAEYIMTALNKLEEAK